LLPRWRGAAPIQAAIWEGDPTTGVTIMKMDAGLDTGDILAERTEPILANDTAGSLGMRLAELGAELLLEILPAYLAGKINLQPQLSRLHFTLNFGQDPAGFLRTIRMGYVSTYAPMLKKEDGELRFDQPVQRLERQVRALQPWPGAFFLWHGQPLKVLQAEAILDGNCLGEMAEQGNYPVVGMLKDRLVLRTEWASGRHLAIGEFGQRNGWPVIGAWGGELMLREVQPAGKKPMSGEMFLRGARDWGRRS
jgi:methionyl-tRNA formyltransferase